MADVALRPTFPADELERLRQERLTALLQARDDPAAVAPLAFSRVRVRADAPLRHERRSARRRRSRRSRRRSCARSTRRAIGRRTPTLIVVGDVTPTGVLPLLESASAPGRRRQRPRATPVPAAPQLAARAGDDRRQAGRRAVADPHRLGRRAALDARLLPAAGAEHDARRLVHLAAEPEPARGARLHLRRQLAVRHAALAGAVLGRAPACRPTRRRSR